MNYVGLVILWNIDTHMTSTIMTKEKSHWRYMWSRVVTNYHQLLIYETYGGNPGYQIYEVRERN